MRAWKSATGITMLLTPFVGLAAWVAHERGWFVAVAMYGCVVALVAWILIGVWLAMGDES